MIGADEWAEKYNQEYKHPQIKMKELGLIEVVSVPESIADCWNCLVEDFDFELPDYITVRDDINWDYFRHYYPEKCKDIMKRSNNK